MYGKNAKKDKKCKTLPKDKRNLEEHARARKTKLCWKLLLCCSVMSLEDVAEEQAIQQMTYSNWGL